MSLCLYDNQNTLCREQWLDGKLILSTPVSEFSNAATRKPGEPRQQMEPFIYGRMTGSPAALPDSLRADAEKMPQSTMAKLLCPYVDKVFSRPEIPICSCRYPLPRIIRHYHHDNGWSIPGVYGKHWLYIICDGCGHQWSLEKLGVSRDWTPEASRTKHFSCVYDNPATMRREWWHDGEEGASLSAVYIATQPEHGDPHPPIEPFEPGKVTGDREALMKPEAIDAAKALLMHLSVSEEESGYEALSPFRPPKEAEMPAILTDAGITQEDVDKYVANYGKQPAGFSGVVAAKTATNAEPWNAGELEALEVLRTEASNLDHNIIDEASELTTEQGADLEAHLDGIRSTIDAGPELTVPLVCGPQNARPEAMTNIVTDNDGRQHFIRGIAPPPNDVMPATWCDLTTANIYDIANARDQLRQSLTVSAPPDTGTMDIHRSEAAGTFTHAQQVAKDALLALSLDHRREVIEQLWRDTDRG